MRLFIGVVIEFCKGALPFREELEPKLANQHDHSLQEHSLTISTAHELISERESKTTDLAVENGNLKRGEVIDISI